MTRRRDTLTRDLFDWQPPQVAVGYGDETTGRAPVGQRISRVVARALRDAKDDGLDRRTIAERMTEYLGRPISVAMIEKWASEGSGDHNIPLDAFAGLIHATGDLNLAGFVPSLFGLIAVEAKYQHIIELKLLEEHQAEVEARAATLRAKVRGVR